MAGVVGGHDLLYNSTQVYIDGGGSGWTNPAYRNIKIKKDTPVSPAFYNWFMANATKIPKLSSVLNDNSWADIAKAADLGIGQNYWSVGDTKEVHLSGTAGGVTWNNDYWVYIIGFDHNSAKEGKGIAFQGFKAAQSGGTDICLIGGAYQSTSGDGFRMNTSNANTGGWNDSYAYKMQCPQIKTCFPSDLQTVIRTTTLYTDNTGNSSTSASNVTSNSNEVYYLAEYEVFGINKYANANETTQQAQYDYYKAGNSKIKYRSDSTGSAAYWQLRSPYRSNRREFCVVAASGNAYDNDANYSYGSAPCFKV